MAYIHVDIDECEFTDSELIGELKSRGYDVRKNGAGTVTELGELEHIEHLAICGLIREARDEALLVVGEHIGRRLN